MIVDWQHHLGSKAVCDRRGGTATRLVRF